MREQNVLVVVETVGMGQLLLIVAGVLVIVVALLLAFLGINIAVAVRQDDQEGVFRSVLAFLRVVLIALIAWAGCGVFSAIQTGAPWVSDFLGWGRFLPVSPILVGLTAAAVIIGGVGGLSVLTRAIARRLTGVLLHKTELVPPVS